MAEQLVGMTFDEFRAANVTRCLKWHPQGINSWSPSDWLTAVTGELGELASLLKMRNRERDCLPGNKFSPTDKQVADEIADVLTYLDLLAAALNVDLGNAAAHKFNEVSERVGFPDRIELRALTPAEQSDGATPDVPSKKEFREQVIKELSLDVSDPFTNLLSHAFALADQRDALKDALAKLREREGCVSVPREQLRITAANLRVWARGNVKPTRIDFDNIAFALEERLAAAAPAEGGRK